MRNKIKFLFVVLLLLMVVACKDTETVDKAPVISGAVDQEIAKGSVFVPLAGITALDEEDGDLTDEINYTGNVNPNRVGTYDATYTVTDSAGNITKVTIKVSVYEVDEDAPLLSGIADSTIALGTPGFNALTGVTANDVIDGDLTSAIEVTGSVNIWQPGEYTLSYSVEDAAGNKTERTRKVTVSLGLFEFDDENVLGMLPEDWTTEGVEVAVVGENLKITVTANGNLSQAVSGGSLNEDIASYAYAKLVFKAKASAATEVAITLDGATGSVDKVALTTTMTEYVRYFRFDEPLEAQDLAFDLGAFIGEIEVENVALYFAKADDKVAPVVTVPEDAVYAPVNDAVAITKLVLRGVTASDDIDGNITSLLQVDLTGLDITTIGEITVPIKAVDKAGNVTTVTRKVNLNAAFNTNIIVDSAFDGELDENQWGLSGGSDGVTLYNQDGMMVVDIVEPGGWDSATSPFIRGLTTNQLLVNNWYMFKFDVKADVARQLRLRTGLELFSDPWLVDFMGGKFSNQQFTVPTEWTTIYYVFYVDQERTTDSNGVKFEIKVGTITWGSEEKNNKVYIDNAQFYLLTAEDDAPVITEKEGVKKTYAIGDAMPDWTQFVTIFDKEDGTIDVTSAMVDASAVDMDAVGTYVVKYSVTDSGGNTTTHDLTISVIDEKDETAPVITVKDDVRFEFDQNEDVTVDLTTYVTAVDDIDGEITIVASMINNGGFAISKAGVFTIQYTVSDSSGNVATAEFTITVLDKEAPKLVGETTKKLILGDIFNPFAIKISDNVDGNIEYTLDDISGLEAFLNVDGVTTSAGEFEVTYSVTDASGNEAIIVFTVIVLDVEIDEDNTIDLLGLELAVNNDGGVESSGVYEEGILTVTYNGVSGWYASFSKLKYMDLNLGKGVYKFVIEAKAQTARDILVRFVHDASGNAVEGFVNRKQIGLTTDFVVLEYVLEITTAGVHSIEVHFGWEDYLNNSSAANVMTFKQIKLIPTIGDEVEEIDPIFMIDDVSYVDQAGVNAAYLHRYNGVNYDDVHTGYSADNGYENGASIKFSYAELGNTGWDLVKTKNPLDNTGLTNDYQYFAFWFKPVDEISKVHVWLYWSGSQGSAEVDVSHIGAEGGFVFVKISDYGKTALDITGYAIGLNYPTVKGSFYLDQFMFVTTPSAIE